MAASQKPRRSQKGALSVVPGACRGGRQEVQIALISSVHCRVA